MKKIGYALLLVSQTFFAQQMDVDLEKLVKVNIGTQGADLAIELPLSNVVVLDVSSGFGGLNKARNFEDGYELSSERGLAYFAKAEAKFYFSRKRRAKKGNDLSGNSGSFIAFQTKFNNNNSLFGKIIFHDIHFGQQLPIGKNTLIAYHIGLGKISNLDYAYSQVMPSFGLKLSYLLTKL